MAPHILSARAVDCEKEPNLCEKPGISSSATGIILGCIAGGILVVLFATLIYFHMRRTRNDQAEWAGKNPQELDDYGLDMRPTSNIKQPQGTYQGPQSKASGQGRGNASWDPRDQDDPFGPSAEVTSGSDPRYGAPPPQKKP